MTLVVLHLAAVGIWLRFQFRKDKKNVEKKKEKKKVLNFKGACAQCVEKQSLPEVEEVNNTPLYVFS